ncbi:MAG: hypothetical protein LC664_10440 [Flavobacteriales bacterium]|nr:hypothetical protein [Flavobacteriales bacterium]
MPKIITTIQQIPNVAWICTLSIAILNNLLFHNPTIDIFCALFSLLLAIFYFYGSFFYFLKISINNWKKAYGELNNFEKIFGFLMGLPFALTAISITFILLRFPGSQIIFFMAVFFLLVVFVLFKSNHSKKISITIRKFAVVNLWLLLIYQCMVALLIAATWSENPLLFEIHSEPSNAPGY